jgi:hypothetical protein
MGCPKAEFFLNDGKSLATVAGRRFDLVFSFDSLVHADVDAIADYVPQIIELLAPSGVAFLHHSNLAAVPGASFGQRSESVSAEIVGDLIRANGGRTLVQERFPGGGSPPTDCFSMFCRANDHLAFETKDISDSGMFAWEGGLARERFQFYLKLGS